MLQKGKSKRSETESFNDSSLLTLKKEGVMSQGMWVASGRWTNPQPTNSKETGTLSPQLHRTKFCQKPEKAYKQFLPQDVPIDNSPGWQTAWL